MTPRIRAALLSGMLLVLTSAFIVHAQDIPRISKEELKAELGNPYLILLDVRIDKDWDPSETKIKSALREDPLKVEEWIGKYPKDKKIVLYCA